SGGPISVTAADLKANILEPITGVLSDTYHVSITAGSNVFLINFVSDTEGGAPLVPLTGTNVQTLIENGLFQSIGIVTLSDGSTVDFQFRSDVEAVPEPSTCILVSLGLLALFASRYRQLKL